MARTTKTLRTDLPLDVWGRLADEAHEKGITIGRLTRDLIVARDAKKYPSASPSTETGEKR